MKPRTDDDWRACHVLVRDVVQAAVAGANNMTVLTLGVTVVATGLDTFRTRISVTIPPHAHDLVVPGASLPAEVSASGGSHVVRLAPFTTVTTSPNRFQPHESEIHP